MGIHHCLPVNDHLYCVGVSWPTYEAIIIEICFHNDLGQNFRNWLANEHNTEKGYISAKELNLSLNCCNLHDGQYPCIHMSYIVIVQLLF